MYYDSLLVLFVVSSLLNIGLALYGWRHRHLAGATAFSLAMLFFSVLPMAQAVNEISSDLAIKVIVFKSRVEMAGIGATLWLVMVMQLSGYSRWVTRRNLIALSITPIVILILNWTENPLFRSGYYLANVGSATVLRWSTGPLFWFGLVYLNVLLLTPLYLLWNSYRRISSLSLQQTLALSISAVLPIVFNLLIQLGVISISAINFPFAAGPLMGLIVAWAIFRYRVFDVVPIARGLLIESMSDGVMVLDVQNRIVDINPAMQQIIGATAIGQSAELAFSAWPDLVVRFRDVNETRTEIAVAEDPPLYFDLRISPLFEKDRQLTGRLIVVRDITRHKQIENALHASENNFRRMLESAPDAMLIVNQEGSITLANVQCEKIFGHPQIELLGQSVEILLPEQFREIHKTHRADYYQNPQARPMGADIKWELLAHRKDGNIFPVEISLSPLDTEAGLFTMAAIRDITERKQLEAQLRLQATALEATVNAIVITDCNGVIQWVNPAFTQLTGYSFTESIGQTPQLIRSGRHNVAFYETLWNTINSGAVWEGEIINRRKDGSEYFEHQTITPVYTERRVISHFISMKQDITQRKQAEQALREAELKYRTLVEQMPAVIYVDELDEAGTSAYVSPQIEALLGYPFSAWEQDPVFWKKCVHPEDYERAIAVTYNTLAQERITEEYRMIAQDGQVIWVRDHSTLARDAAGQPQFVQGFWEDITAYKEAETRQKILYETIRAVVKHLDPVSIAQSAVEAIARFSRWTSIAISIPNPDGETWKTIAGAGSTVGNFGKVRPIQYGVIGRVYRTGLTQYVPDTSLDPDYFRGTKTQSKSELALPIKHHDSILGVLNIESDALNDFNNEDSSLAESLADAISLAFANAYQYGKTQSELRERERTEETLRKQNSYLSALHQITLGLINHHDPDVLLEAILHHAADLMNTRHALVDIVDSEKNVLVQKVAIGNYISQLGFRTKLGEGLAGRVWATGEKIMIPDYSIWENRLPEFSWLRTVASVPMKIQGKVLGVIGVAFDEPDRAFAPEEIEQLQRFANLASMALDNAQLISGATR